MITVRYFAAAAEAAGRDDEQVPAGSGDAVRAALLTRHPALEPILGRCALLADGRRVGASDDVPAGATLDVLPPFAGG
ncbi:MoaD/ThiS family protein [Cellulomonas persica]|uniref:Putative molybdenum cofactor biosynthesis protein D2 (MoaD2) / thiamineS n=1 Tax=Cellulomonas persica TaxID=76861 RepID=A0A510UW96_9CELL|nr:MoaD/ThiS family protein [Cellulomonas persica]GEK18776.1 putative molybdenum cofactor biosynthesis protein D2 (MoaD2) / thiamineS [Cellulomonas persica]